MTTQGIAQVSDDLSSLDFSRHLEQVERLAAEPCRLVLLDGTELTGTLHAYDERGGTIRYAPDGSEARQAVRLDQLRMLVLTRPVRPGEVDTHFLKRGIAAHPLGKRLPFSLTYRDGRNFSGELLGYSFSPGGLGIYLAGDGDEATRYFFPHSAIEDVALGLPLGRVLLDRGHLTDDDLVKALTAQRTQRSQRIGDILSERRVINREALEQALGAQSRKPDVKIGQVLLDMGAITPAQLQEALDEQKRRRGRPLGSILVEMGLLDSNLVKDALADKLGIPNVDLARFRVERQAFESVPARTLLEHRVVPLYRTDRGLVVAMSNPFNVRTLTALAFAAESRIIPVLATADEIERVLGKHRPDGIAVWQHATEGEHIKYLS